MPFHLRISIFNWNWIDTCCICNTALLQQNPFHTIFLTLILTNAILSLNTIRISLVFKNQVLKIRLNYGFSKLCRLKQTFCLFDRPEIISWNGFRRFIICPGKSHFHIFHFESQLLLLFYVRPKNINLIWGRRGEKNVRK